MPKNINYGYQILEATDNNATIIEVLQSNIKRLSQHSHDGQNSIHIKETGGTSLRASGWIPSKQLVWSLNVNDEGLFRLDYTTAIVDKENTGITFLTREAAPDAPNERIITTVNLDYTINSTTNSMAIYSNTKLTELNILYLY